VQKLRFPKKNHQKSFNLRYKNLIYKVLPWFLEKKKNKGKKIFPLKKKQREKNFAFKKKTKGKKKKNTEFCVAVFCIYFRL